MTIFTNGVLSIDGPIGSDLPGGIASAAVVAALAEHPRNQPLTVEINSGGGHGDEGIAIYNALAARTGKVTTIVTGLAASAGSVIAMAGAERVMRRGALMMLHNASGVTIGPAAAHTKTAGMLGLFDDAMAEIYAEAAGRPLAEIKALMDAETWLDGEAAVAAGLATTSEKAEAKAFAAFDYRVYAAAPVQLRALAATNGWTLGGPVDAERQRADALQAELDALKAERADTNALANFDNEQARETQASEYIASRLAASEGIAPLASGLARPSVRQTPHKGPLRFDDFIAR